MLPDCRGVLLLHVHARRQIGREHHAAEIATQLLEIVHLGAHRRLAHQSHQHPRPFCLVDRALVALRAGIARLERLVPHLDLLGAGVGVSPIAAVALAWRFRRVFAVRGGRNRGFGVGFHRRDGRSGCRLRWQRSRILGAVDHRRSLLGLRSEEQLSQASDGRVLVAHQVGQVGVGLGQCLEHREVLFIEFCLGSPQSVFQLAHVDLDHRRFRWHDHTSTRLRRKPRQGDNPAEKGDVRVARTHHNTRRRKRGRSI